jgi:hypothetical protein
MMFRENLSFTSSNVKNPRIKNPPFLTLEDGTERQSRNVGKEMPLLAA